MKAIIRHKYGSPDVLQLEEIEKPIPKDDEVLVKIHAASLNALDWRFLKADPFLIRFDSGLLKPKNKILGLDLSGTVENTGKDAKRFKPGDAVFADILDLRGGALAEYVAIPERMLVPKPENLTFEEAAVVPLVGITAMQALLKQARVRPGQKILIYGASGGLGTLVVQLASALGANVTAVCSSRNVGLVRSLGADHVIDYSNTEFDQIEEPFGGQYDLILAINGYQPIASFKQALRPGGKYILIGGTVKAYFQAKLQGSKSSKSDQKSLGVLEDIVDRTSLLEALTGFLDTRTVVPVIDRRFPFTEVAEAFAYVGQGHAQGKVAITFN